MVTLANEITERNIREQSRENEYNRNLELNQLAQQVAHDIRSPLTALNVAAQKIKDTSADVSEIIKHTSDRINGLADSLLAKFANKNVQITSIAIANLSQILPKVIEEKTLALEKIHKKIHISPPPTTNAEVQINDIDLSRIVSNIIDNAIDSIRKKGEIRITVDEAPDAQAVTLKVRDTGAGIPKEILPNIGQYGFSYGKTNGSGIGLAHAIKILNATGGSLKISSEPNNGTEVSITLKKVQMSGNGLDAP